MSGAAPQTGFYRNLIQNPSGNDGFTGWTITKNFGAQWRTEQVPLCWEEASDGSNSSPKRKTTICFATSQEWCAMSYLIDLEREHLSTKIMKDNVPFQIQVCLSYACGKGCDGALNWSVALLGTWKQTIVSDHRRFVFFGESQWKPLRMVFDFGMNSRLTKDRLEEVKYIEFTIEGRGNRTHQLGMGHHGPKFANAEVIFKQEKVAKPVVIFSKSIPPVPWKRKVTKVMKITTSSKPSERVSKSKLRRSPRIVQLQKRRGVINYKE